ncbi:TetR/AcrR family transcriptional regulator [Streptomyces sp. NPDC048106]|uniref:TetR/AcrR family transcriptional regulator n=1 Tax=Streptomyces sp. NPDC048106 TaxID=3155750 RepID=UPI00345477D5
MTAKQPRADAQRNRARVLEVAARVFAEEGLSVPVHEIARRAGVGTGTVSRHFPRKQDLFAAILLSRLEQLIAQAGSLAGQQDPGTAFFTLLTTLVREGAAHRGLAEALAGAGYDLEAAAEEAGYDATAGLRDLLDRAQAAGAVRSDVDYADVKALMTGCLVRAEGRTGSDLAALERVTAIVCDGLRVGPVSHTGGSRSVEETRGL